jgi:hypothetical protein
MCVPAAEIFARLKLNETISFLDGHNRTGRTGPFDFDPDSDFDPADPNLQILLGNEPIKRVTGKRRWIIGSIPNGK